MAIGASSASHPDQLLLALRGSGQALYVGVADGCYVVASEPYGLVELTSQLPAPGRRHPRQPREPQRQPRPDRRARRPPGRARWTGITRQAYDGTDLPVTDADLQTAQVTTRDIDRGAYPHFLLKEITEAPTSFRKTLRGKLVERDGRRPRPTSATTCCRRPFARACATDASIACR